MSESTHSVRVVTWNVHGCVGRDGRHDVARVAACVRSLAPDIAAFQEVDSRRSAHGHSEICRHLRDQVGAHGHDAWTLSGEDGHYGQVLASRFPLDERRVHDISVPGREPRKVMDARVRLPSMSLRVIATHLGLRRAERRRQVTALRDIIMADLSGPTLLLGDLNEWRRARTARDGLFDLFDAWTTHQSFPSRFPVLPLDRIACRPGALMTGSWVASAAHRASDHLPVVAELSIPAAG